MNLKHFTHTVLFFLCCIFTINAQTVDPSSSDKIDILIKVKDTPDGQNLEVSTGTDAYYITPFNNFNIRVDLDYASTQNITSYCRLKFKFIESEGIGIAGFAFRGITAPVLIPPVKKKKREGNRPVDSVEFPYSTEVEYPIAPKTYEVKMTLLKYETQKDYMEETQNFDPIHTTTFWLVADSPTPLANDAVVVTTFPNPITDHLTIVYAIAPNNGAQQIPLNVTIFDHSGTQVSQHTLTSTSADASSISYNLDTTQLQAGTYFFQLVRNGETTIKTIIKQ